MKCLSRFLFLYVRFFQYRVLKWLSLCCWFAFAPFKTHWLYLARRFLHVSCSGWSLTLPYVTLTYALHISGNRNKTHRCQGCKVDSGGQKVREELPFTSLFHLEMITVVQAREVAAFSVMVWSLELILYVKGVSRALSWLDLCNKQIAWSLVNKRGGRA